VLSLADRILVMYRGSIIGELAGGASRDEVGLMMAGVPAEQAVAEAAEHRSVLAEQDLAEGDSERASQGAQRARSRAEDTEGDSEAGPTSSDDGRGEAQR
jgi:simple sugar transport system ATP-binding protein